MAIENRIEGSISTATLRTEDLIENFMSALEHIVDAETYQNIEQVYQEYLTDFLHEELWPVMDEVAAEMGCEFGSAEGDGADFGFWSREEDEEF